MRRHLLLTSCAVTILTLGILAQIASLSAESRNRANPTEAGSPPPVSFAPAVAYDSGGEPQSVAVADVNGDGNPDVLVANGGVGVLLGNGDGTFQAPVIYATGGFASSIAVADLNGDDKPDLIVANRAVNGKGTVGVLIGNGDGTFQEAVNYDSGGLDPVAVAVGDLNEDGKPDLVVANNNFDPVSRNGQSTVDVLLGKGDGTFRTPVSYESSTAGFATSVAVADLNGDGHLDVVAGIAGDFRVRTRYFDQVADFDRIDVLLGKGDGTLQLAGAYGSGVRFGPGNGFPSSENGPFVSVAIADVNGDGRPDLVEGIGLAFNSLGWKTFPSAVYMGNGDGSFQGASKFNAAVCDPVSIATADLNQDGRPDLVIFGNGTFPCSQKNKAAVLLGNGDGTFQPAKVCQTAGSIGGAIAVADVNGDARPDLVAADSFGPDEISGSVGILLNIKVSTKTILTTSISKSLVGQPVTFTATIKWAHGAIPDGETVNFFDGSTAIGTGTTTGGVAELTTSSLTAKTHTVKSAYAGDTNFEPSIGVVKQVVDGYPTTTNLASSPRPSHLGEAVTFTVRVVGTGPVAPTGKVKFMDSGLMFGSATLTDGMAAFTYSRLQLGTHAITAEYLGDDASAESTSKVLSQVVK